MPVVSPQDVLQVEAGYDWIVVIAFETYRISWGFFSQEVLMVLIAASEKRANDLMN